MCLDYTITDKLPELKVCTVDTSVAEAEADVLVVGPTD